MQRTALVKEPFQPQLPGNDNGLAKDDTNMAHTTYRNRPAGLPARAALTLGGLVSRVSAWNDARRTRNALAKLSAHELDDIGLAPGDIDRIGGTRF